MKNAKWLTYTKFAYGLVAISIYIFIFVVNFILLFLLKVTKHIKNNFYVILYLTFGSNADLFQPTLQSNVEKIL